MQQRNCAHIITFSCPVFLPFIGDLWSLGTVDSKAESQEK
jgi:hypothetical protein